MTGSEKRKAHPEPADGSEEQPAVKRRAPKEIFIIDGDDNEVTVKGTGTSDDPFKISEWVTGNVIDPEKIDDSFMVIDDDDEGGTNGQPAMRRAPREILMTDDDDDDEVVEVDKIGGNEEGGSDGQPAITTLAPKHILIIDDDDDDDDDEVVEDDEYGSGKGATPQDTNLQGRDSIVPSSEPEERLPGTNQSASNGENEDGSDVEDNNQDHSDSNNPLWLLSESPSPPPFLEVDSALDDSRRTVDRDHEDSEEYEEFADAQTTISLHDDSRRTISPEHEDGEGHEELADTQKRFSLYDESTWRITPGPSSNHHPPPGSLTSDLLSTPDNDEDEDDFRYIIYIGDDEEDIDFSQAMEQVPIWPDWKDDIKEEQDDEQVPGLSSSQDTSDSDDSDDPETPSSTQTSIGFLEDSGAGIGNEPLSARVDGGIDAESLSQIEDKLRALNNRQLDGAGALERNKLKKRLFYYLYGSGSLMPKLKAKLTAFFSGLSRTRTRDECWIYDGPLPYGINERRNIVFGICFTHKRFRGFNYTAHIGFISRLVEGLLTHEEKEGIIENKWHASHLCGNWTCINPYHINPEAGYINQNRKHCHSQPTTPCPHFPPCLKHLKIEESPPPSTGKATKRSKDVKNRKEAPASSTRVKWLATEEGHILPLHRRPSKAVPCPPFE